MSMPTVEEKKHYTVAVLGLGAMGLPMATRLATRLTVRGFDVAENRLQLAAEAGVARCDSAREAVAGADAVLLAVRDGAQLDEVLFGIDGVAQALTPGSPRSRPCWSGSRRSRARAPAPPRSRQTARR